jgi:hypothetical protein
MRASASRRLADEDEAPGTVIRGVDGLMAAAGEQAGEEALRIPVVPTQAFEFVCPCCRLVRHRSQLTAGSLCRDCA